MNVKDSYLGKVSEVSGRKERKKEIFQDLYFFFYFFFYEPPFVEEYRVVHGPCPPQHTYIPPPRLTHTSD